MTQPMDMCLTLRAMTTSPTPSVDDLIDALWNAGGTDLLLTSGAMPLIRVDGEMRPVVSTEALTPDDTRRLLAEVLSPEQLTVFESQHEYDFSFGWRGHA